MAKRAVDTPGQDRLPVFGPSLSGDGSPRCSDWTRKQQPCARTATVAGDGRHGPLCRQHAEARWTKRGRS